MTTPTPTPGAPIGLTIEAIVAIETPREFRLHPRDRSVAFTAEHAGARQVFRLNLRGGAPVPITASEKDVSDPQWSPDGRRLAYVRDDELWVVEADGSRTTLVVAKPGGGTEPRWSPDGGRLAFLSRRRGWSQVWVIDAPVPRRGRPANEPKVPVARAVTRRRPRRRRVRLVARRRSPRGHGPARPDPPGRGGDRPRGRGDRHERDRRRDGWLRVRRHLDGGWFDALRDRRERLVPGRPSLGRTGATGSSSPRASGSTANPAVASGTCRLPSPGWCPLRPHRGPRRAAGPCRRRDSGRDRPEARSRPTAQDTADGGRRWSGPAAGPLGRCLADGRLARRRRVDRGDRRERGPAPGPVAAPRPGRRPG